MGFQLVESRKLSDSVKESVRTLLVDHDLDPNRQDDSLKKLSDERRIHAQLLLKIVDLLDGSNLGSKEKALILNGAVYFVRDQIKQSYEKRIINPLSPERSVFYNSLSQSLDLTKENKPNREDLVEMYSTFSNFLHMNVYALGDPSKGYLIVPQQPFSPDKIKGYSVETDIKSLVDAIHVMKEKQREDAAVLQTKQLAEAKKAGGKANRGIAGLLFSGTTPAAAAAPPGTTSSAEFK